MLQVPGTVRVAVQSDWQPTPLVRRRPDIPTPYVLLLDIPLPVIPIPDIPIKKIGISIMFAVFLPNIPIPDIYTRFRNNEHNFTKKCSLFLQKNVCRYIDQFLIKKCSLFLFVVISSIF